MNDQMNYDPNMTNSGRMAKQTVKMVFQTWEYMAVRSEVIGGNCTGFDVIGAAVGNAYDNLLTERGIPYIEMMDMDGNELVCEDDENRGENWLKDMLVKAEIVSIEAECAV